ncbi:AGAP006872-PA-like protein [Anopheles sinensis]|uniref:AGAP006872-PA-like protein n=1 Tax=Anopheles sinensis TaxID=74873 RepID=A0A084W6A6_ANOSI|nr:AGAP006872-PA-like protein [Anopheles sinensis]
MLHIRTQPYFIQLEQNVNRLFYSFSSLYTSKEQQDRDLYVKLLDVYPLPHSILVLVKTNCPLV